MRLLTNILGISSIYESSGTYWFDYLVEEFENRFAISKKLDLTGWTQHYRALKGISGAFAGYEFDLSCNGAIVEIFPVISSSEYLEQTYYQDLVNQVSIKWNSFNEFSPW